MKQIAYLLLTLCGAYASIAAPAFIDYDLHLIFPSELEGLTFEAVDQYDTAEKGYRVIYRKDETFTAKITVNTLGFELIPDGPSGEAIEAMIAKEDSWLKSQAFIGQISDIKKRGSSVVPPKGKLQFSACSYSYVDQKEGSRIPSIQNTYATGNRNRLISLTFAFPANKNFVAKKTANAILARLTKIISSDADGDAILLAACSTFLNNPATTEGITAAQYIVSQAPTLDNLSIYPHLLAWPQDEQAPENSGLLIAAYYAGMIQVVLPKKLDQGGDVEAFTAMLSTYQKLREQEIITVIPTFDEWSRHPDKKALFKQLLTSEN